MERLKWKILVSFVKKPPKKNSKFRVSKDELAKKKQKALLKPSTRARPEAARKVKWREYWWRR